MEYGVYSSRGDDSRKMNRKAKQFHILAKKLDEEIEESKEIFFAQRPWLLNQSQEAVLKERTDDEIERKIQNDIVVDELIKEIRIYATNK